MNRNLELYQKGSVIYLIISFFLPFLNVGDQTFCPFRLATNLPCPGCGMTHSLHHLLLLNPGEAFYYHPMGFLLLPVFLFFAATIFWEKGRLLFNRYEKKFNYAFMTGGIVLLIFGIYRIMILLQTGEVYHP